MKLRTVNIALSPNNTWQDSLMAAWLLLPWNWPWWKRGRAVDKLEKRFREMIGVDFAMAVGSGREALYLILKSLELTPGDEVIVQSFTCMVVINSILWNGLVPKYVDIDESYNFSLEELKQKVSEKTRAVIVQHTFGIPSPELVKIKEFCLQEKIVLIEDCAHAMGAEIDGKKVGTLGDFGFFSLGRSKVISCVNGGIIVTNDENWIKKLQEEKMKLEAPSSWRTAQDLLHPLISSVAKIFYFSAIGKAFMFLSQKLKLINLEVTSLEKKALMPKYFMTRLSNAMAKIALVQLKQLNTFNKKRRLAADFYYKNLDVEQKFDPSKSPGAIFLRYPIEVTNPGKVLKAARKEGIYLGDWYTLPIAPADIDTSKTGYKTGECKQCEKVNKQIINLPTMQSLKLSDLQKIVEIVNQNAKS